MPIIEIEKYRCPKCGKEYEDSVRGHFPGKPCKECTQLMMKVNQLERQLIAEEFSIEQEDEKVIRQINNLIVKEGTDITLIDENLISGLGVRLLKDEKRRKKIIKELLKLQKKKR